LIKGFFSGHISNFFDIHTFVNKKLMMEYKNTIEALHFNAEEIRQLVASLENSERISRIDIDLILEKIRSLYDLVLDIQATINDNKVPVGQSEHIIYDVKPAQPTETVKPENKVETASDKPEKSTDIIFEDNTVSLKERIFFKSPHEDNPNHEKSDEQKLNERKQVAKENLEKDLKKEKIKSEELVSKKSFVSDRFKSSQPTLHDELASKTKQDDIVSQLKSQGASGIASTLGLNEKFELINELFDGNKEKFEFTMQVLNEAGSFVEAYNYLKDNFKWDMDSQYVQRMLELIRRKLIVRRNDQ
jgi:hypothetical protein